MKCSDTSEVMEGRDGRRGLSVSDGARLSAQTAQSPLGECPRATRGASQIGASSRAEQNLSTEGGHDTDGETSDVRDK
jgi:hypothetical protein